MGAIEDLVAAIAGQSAQQNIARDNTYLKFKDIPDQMGNTVIQAASHPGRFSTSELIANGIGAGLLSGGLDSLGQDYQKTLTDRYKNVVANSMTDGRFENPGLSGELFRSAKDAGSMFKLREIYSDAQDAKQQKGAILSALAKADTPREQQRVLQAAKALGLVDSDTDFGGLGEKRPISRDADDPTVEGGIADEVGNTAQRFQEEYGGTPGAAFDAASKIYSAKRGELDRQYKRVEEAEKGASDLSALSQQMRMALQGAGYTGAGGTALQALAGVTGLVNEDQRKKYAAGQEVETFAKDIIALTGKAFKGPMSDRDVQLMLKSGPSVSNAPEVNESILQRWDYAANLQKEYASFMRDKQNQGVPVSKAEAEWQAFKKENPYIIKSASGYELNPFWLGESDTGHGTSSSWGDEPNTTEKTGGSYTTSQLQAMGAKKVPGGWELP